MEENHEEKEDFVHNNQYLYGSIIDVYVNFV